MSPGGQVTALLWGRVSLLRTPLHHGPRAPLVLAPPSAGEGSQTMASANPAPPRYLTDSQHHKRHWRPSNNNV